MVPEHHPHFIGTYWGAVSTAFFAEIVESADAYLFAGPIFNEYNSVGYSLLLKKEKAIIVQPDRVVVANGPAFGCVLMKAQAVPEGTCKATQAQAVAEKRVIACIGDGSFQVTAQGVSTMLRCGQNTIIFLINNGGFTIEVEIHDGPYNVVKNRNTLH